MKLEFCMEKWRRGGSCLREGLVEEAGEEVPFGAHGDEGLDKFGAGCGMGPEVVDGDAGVVPSVGLAEVGGVLDDGDGGVDFDVAGELKDEVGANYGAADLAGVV